MYQRPKEMGVWLTMRNRCRNPNTKSYEYYGGRGITVCPEWNAADGFARFMADMGPRPEGGEIERIDNDGPYSPGNCRWAMRAEQVRNKRNNRWITANGETKTLAEWAESLGVTHTAILRRLQTGCSPEDAVTRPAPKRPNSKLSDDQVREMRSLHPGLSIPKIAERFGVSAVTARSIIRWRTFIDLE